MVVCLFLFISAITHSQQVLLEGRIVAAEETDVEGINIFNHSTSKGTISDTEGNFAIAASVADTLSISAVHIETKKIVISEEQVKYKKVKVLLEERVNQLPTVKLMRPLSGFIGTDVKLIKVNPPITAFGVGIPQADLKPLTKTERAIYAASTGPVDVVLNAISGRTKMLKKRLEFEKTYNLTLTLLEKFPETYYIQALGIKKHQIYSFIFFCEEDPEYKKAVKGKTMETIDFLRRKSKEFNERS